MYIVDFCGGLGNQMYQYALFRALQEKGIDAKMSTIHYEHTGDHIPQHGKSFLLADIFNIKADYADKKYINRLGDVSRGFFARALRKLGCYKKTHKKESECDYPTMDQILSYKKAYLEGYWQNFDYSRQIEDKLRQELTFKQPLDEKNAQIAQQIKNCNAVSIHVRRNDYLNVPMYKIQDGNYYVSAVEFVKQNVENPVFFCFSDDIEWCKNTFKDCNMVFVDWNSGTDSYRDMQLMSMCKHNIVANSTFSVWAAWLNNNPQKIVIRPKEYFNDGYVERDFAWPCEWIIK